MKELTTRNNKNDILMVSVKTCNTRGMFLFIFMFLSLKMNFKNKCKIYKHELLL